MSKLDRLQVILAEDDEDDYLLTQEAFKEAKIINHLHRVKDGEELMNYLHKEISNPSTLNSSPPLIILLDLNMPRKSGREALKEIKSDPKLRSIPVVILTTSKAEEDILMSYDLGCNSFIRKPVSFEQFVNVIKEFKKYWLEIVELPIDQ